MTRQEFISKVSALVEQEVDEETRLAAILTWDSMCAISFIVMADKDLGVSVSPPSLLQCTTVADLANLVKDRLV